MLRHEEKIQKKNKQILDYSEQKKTGLTIIKEEIKENEFEDKNINEWILKIKQKIIKNPQSHNSFQDSLFMNEFRKRFKSSESEKSIFKYNPVNRPGSLKVIFNSNYFYPSIKLNSPILLWKKSEAESLFNDSSIRDYFEKKINELKKSPKANQKFLCQDPGCFKSFSNVSFLLHFPSNFT